MAGRPPLPSAIRATTIDHHRPLNEFEPQLPIEAPEPPKFLTADERRLWDWHVAIFLQLRVLTKADEPALTRVCQTAAILEAAQKVLSEDGYFILGKDGLKHVNPAYRIVNQMGAAYDRMINQFGATPSARSRLVAAPQKKATQSSRWATLAARTNPSRKREAEGA